MSEMAMVVARNLKADVLDESQSALTPQTIEANREEIMAFERHQHLMMKKQGTR
jgi:cell division protein ZipA